MKIYMCLFVFAIFMSSVRSFKIFPIENRKLSASWTVDSLDTQTTSSTESTSTSIVTTAASEISTEVFTNAPENLRVIAEVTLSEETATNTAETITPSEPKKEDSPDTTKLNLTSVSINETSTSKSVEPTTEITTNVPDISSEAPADSTDKSEISTKTTDIVVLPSSTETVAVTSKSDSKTVEVTTEAAEKPSTLVTLVETTPSLPSPELSVDLLPPKTEFRKYDFDPRYDDWNNVPLNFEYI